MSGLQTSRNCEATRVLFYVVEVGVICLHQEKANAGSYWEILLEGKCHLSMRFLIYNEIFPILVALWETANLPLKTRRAGTRGIQEPCPSENLGFTLQEGSLTAKPMVLPRHDTLPASTHRGVLGHSTSLQRWLCVTWLLLYLPGPQRQGTKSKEERHWGRCGGSRSWFVTRNSMWLRYQQQALVILTL